MINVLRKQSGDEQSFANLATEYSLGDTELASQYLLIRERMMNTLNLPYSPDKVFGKNLVEIVELSPFAAYSTHCH